jgi:hypothetical protein
MATVLTKEKYVVTTTTVNELSDSDSKTRETRDFIPPLGVPREEKRFFFQRTSRNYDPNAIATLVRPPSDSRVLLASGKHYKRLFYLHWFVQPQPSVFDDPDTAEKYQPPAHW